MSRDFGYNRCMRLDLPSPLECISFRGGTHECLDFSLSRCRIFFSHFSWWRNFEGFPVDSSLARQELGQRASRAAFSSFEQIRPSQMVAWFQLSQCLIFGASITLRCMGFYDELCNSMPHPFQAATGIGLFNCRIKNVSDNQSNCWTDWCILC